MNERHSTTIELIKDRKHELNAIMNRLGSYKVGLVYAGLRFKFKMSFGTTANITNLCMNKL